MKNLLLLFVLIAFLFQPQTTIAVERTAQSNIEAVATVKPSKNSKRQEKLKKRWNKKLKSISMEKGGSGSEAYKQSEKALLWAILFPPVGIGLAIKGISRGKRALKLFEQEPNEYEEKAAKNAIGLSIIALIVAVGLLFYIFSFAWFPI